MTGVARLGVGVPGEGGDLEAIPSGTIPTGVGGTRYWLVAVKPAAFKEELR